MTSSVPEFWSDSASLKYYHLMEGDEERGYSETEDAEPEKLCFSVNAPVSLQSKATVEMNKLGSFIR